MSLWVSGQYILLENPGRASQKRAESFGCAGDHRTYPELSLPAKSSRRGRSFATLCHLTSSSSNRTLLRGRFLDAWLRERIRASTE